MGAVSRGSCRSRAFRLVPLPQRRQARRHPRFGPAGRPGGRPRTHRAGACAHRGFRAGDAGRSGAGPGRVEPAEPKPGAVAHLSFRSVRTLAPAAGHAPDRAGGIGLDQHPGSGPPTGTGRRPHLRVRRGRLRRARRADRAAAAARRPGQGGRRLPVGGAAVDAALSDADGAPDATPRLARQPAVGPHAGRRAGRRRMGGHQLPDGPALAGRVRDARPARVRRASDRDHDGRAGARRVLSQGGATAGTADRRRDRGTRAGAAHSGRAGQRRGHGV